jgi:hypothetical protein
MLSECNENEDLVRAANSKDEYFSAESLFMVLILQQQKTINELVKRYQPRSQNDITITYVFLLIHCGT